jgi:extradiol dioxygenase family protein
MPIRLALHQGAEVTARYAFWKLVLGAQHDREVNWQSKLKMVGHFLVVHLSPKLRRTEEKTQINASKT